MKAPSLPRLAFVLLTVFAVGMALCGPRPQPQSGAGWRLLRVDNTGEPPRQATDPATLAERSALRGIATSNAQFAVVWGNARRPEVDFETEIVLSFTALYLGGCPIRLSDVIFDEDQRMVYPHLIRRTRTLGCNDSANYETYMVAVERSALPKAPFNVQASDDPSAVDDGDGVTVTADLRRLGSTVSPEQMVGVLSE
jgi:hypothetical protein